jgi:glucosylceramidase
MRSFSRRNFLKLTSAAGLCSFAGLSNGRARTDDSGEIQVRVTGLSKPFAQQSALRWQSASAPTSDCISINPERRFQEILGFGAALTDAACYNLNRLASGARQELFHELFHPAETGLSVCRICIGSSDYATKAYSYDEGGPDPELAHFTIEHDLEYVIPMLRLARSVNPDLFLLASPWSPPAWMKVNGSMLGGLMEKKYFPAYARYLVKFLQAYQDAGVKVNAISIQNEVDTEQDSRMPASLWGQEYETGFISQHLGKALAANRLDTKIWIIDHNYNLWGRAICELDDPSVNKYVDGVAWHGYLGEPSAMTRVHDAHPEKNMYWTEGGPNISAPGYRTDWPEWSKTFSGILNNWARCIIAWNLALDENGKPNIGPFDCGGTITINSQTREITRSGQYWALAHYARTVRRGARRVESSGDINGVSHVVVINNDGSAAAILTNSGSEKKVALQVSNKETHATLPAHSISTLSWIL